MGTWTGRFKKNPPKIKLICQKGTNVGCWMRKNPKLLPGPAGILHSWRQFSEGGLKKKSMRYSSFSW